MAPLSGPFDKTGTWGGVMGGIGEKDMPLKNRIGSYYLILEFFRIHSGIKSEFKKLNSLLRERVCIKIILPFPDNS